MAKQSLAIKYRPKTFNDVTEQDNIKIILQQQLQSNEIKHSYLFVGGAGTGKAQPLYSKILTPNGFTTMGEIKVGDKVFTHSGNITVVTDIFPQGKRPIYEITLQDRSKIRVADNHLNSVYVYNTIKRVREDYTLTTLELIKFLDTSKYKVRIDTPKVDFSPSKILIDPYLLGALIGDGCLNDTLKFSNPETDVVQKVDNILRRDYKMYLKPIKGCDYTIRYVNNPKHNGSNYNPLDTLKGQLRHYGLLCKSINKHIPTEYLLNTEDVRLKLLQGLFDTDGTSGKGDTNYSTSSKQLSDDFTFLVRSLGIRDTVSTKVGKYKKDGEIVVCNNSYIHFLHIPNELKYCTSNKHLNRHKNRQNPPIRNIIDIKYIGDEECQCIMVEHSDHTYISDDFIPTHNTTCARILANEINNNVGNPIELDGASNNSVDDMRELIKQAQTKSIDSEYKVMIVDECHMITIQGWNALLKILEEPPAKSIFIFCTTDVNRIPKTILSRVQRYDFRMISQQGIVDRLNCVLVNEGKDNFEYDWDKNAIEYIAKLSNGHMRDALTMLDKCLAYNNELTLDNVVKALGVADYDLMMLLTDAILENDIENTFAIIDNVYMSGVDLKQFVKQYMEFIFEVIKYGVFKDINKTQLPNVDILVNWIADVKDCHKILDTLVELNKELKYNMSPKFLVEYMLTEGMNE